MVLIRKKAGGSLSESRREKGETVWKKGYVIYMYTSINFIFLVRVSFFFFLS